MNNLQINTNVNQLDIHFIHEFISNTYWAKGRTLETMQNCIKNSLNFGVYLHGKQIGYARLVTDYNIFAYIMDLFIQEDFRGKSYSKELMKNILECELVKDVKVWRLATTDAHGLYEQFGFHKTANPEKLMELIR
jgi:predicted GNAT family N-acyltransferase